MTRPRPVPLVSGRRPPCPGRGPGWPERGEETDFIPTVADSVAPRQPLPPAARSSNIYKYSPYLYHSYRQWEMGSCDGVYYNLIITVKLVQWNQKHSWNYIENEPLSLFLSWQFEPRPSTSCSDQTSSSSASSGLQKTLHLIIDYLGDGAQQSVHSPALSPLTQLHLLYVIAKQIGSNFP